MKNPRYSRSRVESILAAVQLPPSYRIIFRRYLRAPLGTAPTNSRFCAKTAGFTALYAASDFNSAFLETVVRDRFTHKHRREIERKKVIERAWTRIESQPGTTLQLLDLRRDGCFSLGAPTDTVHSRNHTAGRSFGKAIHTGYPDVDGFLYASRLTGADVYAVFDRGIGKLRLMDSGILPHHPELPKILQRYDIRLVDEA